MFISGDGNFKQNVSFLQDDEFSKRINKYVARNWQNNAPDFEIYDNFKDLLKNRAKALGNIIFAPNE